MTPTQIRELRGDRRKVTFARLLGVHTRTVSNWETGKTYPQPAHLMQLQALEQGKVPNRSLYSATDEELLLEISRRMHRRHA